MFAYIVKEGHYQTEDTITKVLNDDKCDLPCEIYEYLVNEDIHYEEYVIR